jgi:hypothetical protein
MKRNISTQQARYLSDLNCNIRQPEDAEIEDFTKNPYRFFINGNMFIITPSNGHSLMTMAAAMFGNLNIHQPELKSLAHARGGLRRLKIRRAEYQRIIDSLDAEILSLQKAVTAWEYNDAPVQIIDTPMPKKRGRKKKDERFSAKEIIELLHSGKLEKMLAAGEVTIEELGI